MADSLFPVLGAWWRNQGTRQGDGATLPPGASTTPYGSSAVPAEPRRFTFEITYSAAAAAKVDLRVNWFSASKTKVSGPFNLVSVALDAAQGKTVTVEVTLPDNPSPRWLPSVGVPSDSGEVTISSLKVYETPAPAGPTAAVWDGATEIPCAVTVWDGLRELPATVEIQS
jgi:hypothetical protein|nr:MAG TPA: hypothetical protein [Caudoviricetes sp.]